MEDIINGFCGSGNNVVLHIPTPTRGVSDEIRKEYKRKRAEIKHNGRLKILRYALIKETKNPLSRALRYFLQNIKQYFLGIKEKNVDLIFAASTPPTQGAMCAMVKKKLCKKYKRYVPFVYNLQDIFPDSLVNTGLSKKGSLLYKIGRKIEDYTYKNADKIIVIGEDFKKNIMAKGVPEEKIEVIPNWVEERAFLKIPRENNSLFDRYGLDRSKFHIAYCGNIGLTQNMQLLVKAAKVLSKDTNIHFTIVGEGVYKEELKKQIAENSLTNITLIPFQPYEQISEVFSLGDVGLIISKAGVGNNSVPSKTWSYMAAGKPILASFDSNSELAEIIGREKCGICAKADDLDEFVKAVKELSRSENLQSSGDNGRRYVKENLSSAAGTKRYIYTINLIVKPTNT